MYLIVTRWFGERPPYRRRGEVPGRFDGPPHHGPKGKEAVPAYAKTAW